MLLLPRTRDHRITYQNDYCYGDYCYGDVDMMMFVCIIPSNKNTDVYFVMYEAKPFCSCFLPVP